MTLRKWSKTDDPDDRCDFIINSGDQCGNFAADGVARCEMHGANKQLAALENKSLRVYRLAKHGARIAEHADHSKVKGLREEIGILRILLEEKWNSVDNDHELLLMSGPIADLVMKIEKLVASCHRLEASLGGLLDKAKVKQIANEMMNSVNTRINEILEDVSPDLTSKLLEAIAGDVLESLEKKE